MALPIHVPLFFLSSPLLPQLQSGVSGYMVGAMDDDMLRELVALDIHTWRMNTGITKRDLGWGSQNFHLMGRWVGGGSCRRGHLLM